MENSNKGRDLFAEEDIPKDAFISFSGDYKYKDFYEFELAQRVQGRSWSDMARQRSRRQNAPCRSQYANAEAITPEWYASKEAYVTLDSPKICGKDVALKGYAIASDRNTCIIGSPNGKRRRGINAQFANHQRSEANAE
eukprot:scaffold5558_cov241-Pinguiococcus_pyrenoidosus.AAC.3